MPCVVRGLSNLGKGLGLQVCFPRLPPGDHRVVLDSGTEKVLICGARNPQTVIRSCSNRYKSSSAPCQLWNLGRELGL